MNNNSFSNQLDALLAQSSAAEDDVHGALAVADVADKEVDRNVEAIRTNTPAVVDTPDADGIKPSQYVAANEAQAALDDVNRLTAEAAELVFDMPPLSYMKSGQHHKLVFQGVCSNCAHCGMPLTDSVSIERGLGPICSAKGYLEEPTNPDEMQAMIDLAEYPALVEFLVKKYKPLGVRGLMNGLTKICSLNRRSPVHSACTDAIDSLGYVKLASLLRESIAVIELKHHDASTFHLWVKKSEWHPAWSYDLRRIPGAYFSKQQKGWMVPKQEKPALWALMLKHYEGLCAILHEPDAAGTGTIKRTIKIRKVVKKAVATA